MKVLWVCNIVLPQFAEIFGLPMSFGGGWMSSLYNDLQSRDDIELAVCSPVDLKVFNNLSSTKYVNHQNICYLFPENLKDPHVFCSETKSVLEEIIKEYKPDVVHIHGTEYHHTLDLTEILPNNKYIISIQGLTKYIAESYLLGISKKELNKQTFRDFIRRDSIILQQRKFSCRGEFEEQAIKNSKYIIGRTDWDERCTRLLNPDVHYYCCNENLRASFYDNQWNINKCKKNSIFISQCNSPIKGFHIFLKALSIVKKFYPDVTVYTTGVNPLTYSKFRISSYQRYLSNLIKKYDLVDNIHFLGGLSEDKMVDMMLKSNVFVCPSVIENSSNSIGEAMLLGMPIIASNVGGTKSLLADKIDGLLYSPIEYYVLASLILDVFRDNYDDTMIENTKKKASQIFNRNINSNTLYDIYVSVYKGD